MTNTEKIKAEIERRLEKYDPDYTSAGRELEKLLSFIASLQQEQPEVDLDEEVDKFLNETGAPYAWCNDDEQKEWCNIIARHFYELGLKAKEE